jgi:hypothetical protein
MKGLDVMILNISPDRRIYGGEYQWEVQKLHIVKGQRRWRSYLYFPDVRSAVQWLARDEIRTADVEGLAQAIETAERVAAKFAALIDGPVEKLAERAKLRVAS